MRALLHHLFENSPFASGGLLLMLFGSASVLLRQLPQPDRNRLHASNDA